MKNLFTALFLTASFFVANAQTKNSQISKLYQNYLTLKSALVSDQAANATKAANAFIKTAGTIDYKLISEGNIEKLKKDATAISNEKRIQKQRSYFFNLSDNMIAIAKKYKVSDSSAYVQYCPMAKGSWLSDSKKIANPYYGSQMLSCGTVQSELK